MKWGPANQNKAFHDRSCLDASNGLHKYTDTLRSHHDRESDMGVYCGSAMNRFSAAAQSAAIRHGTDNPLWVASFNPIVMLDNNALPAGTRPAVWQEAATSHVYSFENQQRPYEPPALVCEFCKQPIILREDGVANQFEDDHELAQSATPTRPINRQPHSTCQSLCPKTKPAPSEKWPG